MPNRRNLLKALIASAVSVAMVPYAQGNDRAVNTMQPIMAHKPARLRAGQTIGLIAPGSNAWEDEEIRFAMDILKSFGFKVKSGQHLMQRSGYLAGGDRERAADINQMFADKEVHSIFCLRGGYGSPRLLPYLDYALIKQNPKVLLGYSDVTALLNAIYARCDLVTFHGPIAKQNFSDYTLARFKEVLFNPQAPIDLAMPPPFAAREGQAEQENRLITVSPGQASGVLIGGNLSLMVKLVGSPYEPDYQGKLLFLEDVEEAPYRIDGMLTHLTLAGRLDKVAGVVFGKCTDCDATSPPSFSIEHVLKDRLGSLGVPVLSGVMIGHVEDMATIPIGVMATLDASAKRLVLNEAGVT
jgi:muramoyltetrapeptide carboxypeptidase